MLSAARVSVWFNAASANRPGAANRTLEILRTMLRAAHQWGDLGEDAASRLRIHDSRHSQPAGL